MSTASRSEKKRLQARKDCNLWKIFNFLKKWRGSQEENCVNPGWARSRPRRRCPRSNVQLVRKRSSKMGCAECVLLRHDTIKVNQSWFHLNVQKLILKKLIPKQIRPVGRREAVRCTKPDKCRTCPKAGMADLHKTPCSSSSGQGEFVSIVGAWPWYSRKPWSCELQTCENNGPWCTAPVLFKKTLYKKIRLSFPGQGYIYISWLHTWN